MRIDLPDGGYAVLRDPRKIPGRLADAIEEAQIELFLTPAADHLADKDKADAFNALPFHKQVALLGREGFAAMRAMQRAKVLAYVSAWSLGDITAEKVADLPGDTFAAISEAIAQVENAVGAPALDTSISPDPESPSTPSSV